MAEDLILLVLPTSVHLYCNPVNAVANGIAARVAHWPNLRTHRLDAARFDADPDAAEEFKIKAFKRMMRRCGRRVGLPFLTAREAERAERTRMTRRKEEEKGEEKEEEEKYDERSSN